MFTEHLVLQLATSMLVAVYCAGKFNMLETDACIRSYYLPSRQFKIVLYILFSSDFLYPVSTDPNNQAFILFYVSTQLC